MRMKSVQVMSFYQIDIRILFNIESNCFVNDIVFRFFLILTLHRLSYQTLAFFIQNPVKEQSTKLMCSPLTGLTSPLSKKSIKRLKSDLLFFIIQTKMSRFTQLLNCLLFLHLSAAQVAIQAFLLDFLSLVQYYSFVISLKNYLLESCLNIGTGWI